MLAGDPDVTIFFGTDIEGEGTKIGVKDAVAHPMWTGNLSGGHDVGMLLMNFPQEEVEATALSTFDLTTMVGTEVERVGFGIYDAGSMAQDGKKRAGATTITSVPSGADTFIAGDADLITCSGDSGGPAYLTVDGTTYLAGVHSFGLEGCTSPHNGDTRVELYAEDFIQPWIQANDPSCGADLFCAAVLPTLWSESQGSSPNQPAVSCGEHTSAAVDSCTNDRCVVAKLFCCRVVCYPSSSCGVCCLGGRTERCPQHIFHDADGMGLHPLC